MTEPDATLLVQEIIKKAQDGKAHPFRPILYWSEFRYYRQFAFSTKVVIKTLRASAERLFKDYCKDVIAGISDFTKLLAYYELLDITAFYENDLITIQRMLEDYKEYLDTTSFGNMFSAFFGGRREV